MLIGRETEMAGLGKLLDAARLGTSGALVVRGEAGIGKSALLEQAAAMAGDFRVLRATGIESEGELPYAALHQLLRPLEDRIDRLAEPQARALSGALGLAHEREADRFLIGVGVLTLLADAADEKPLLALLDDAAWFDHESAHALGFTARRLQAEGVVLLFAVRDEPGQAFAVPGVAELRVGRLPDAEARQLVGDRVDAARRDAVVARAHGNPLALLELASGPDGTAPGGAEEAFARRVRALPERTQELLLIAAADTTTSLATVGGAAAGLGLDAAALAPAESDGLVHAVAGKIEFRHPLVRSAVYHAAPFEARARAHQALADALTGDQNADRRAWHHAAAVLGTDEEAAAELEGTASRAMERSGLAAAAAALERAGELSPDEDDRRRRLVAAAQAASMAGERERSLAILDRVGSVGRTGPRRRHRVDTRLGGDRHGRTGRGVRMVHAGRARRPDGSAADCIDRCRPRARGRGPGAHSRSGWPSSAVSLTGHAGEQRRRARDARGRGGLHRVRRRRLRRGVPRARPRSGACRAVHRRAHAAPRVLGRGVHRRSSRMRRGSPLGQSSSRGPPAPSVR